MATLILLVFITLISSACCFSTVHSFVSSRRTNILQGATTTPPTLRFSSRKNWDEILDKYDEEEDEGPPIPRDMQYNPRNVMRQNQNFIAIRDAGGKEMTNDVYCREPKNQVFWFVGKVARVSDVTLEQAVARQWNLIETHAANLRPIELFPSKGSLELWTAEGDSELEVAYNRPDLVFQKMERVVPGAEGIKNMMIGFQGEIYEGGEEGFRTFRLEDGRPANPEIETPNQEDMRPPTDEEMEQLQQKLESNDIDINELYEEQQRREGKPL